MPCDDCGVCFLMWDHKIWELGWLIIATVIEEWNNLISSFSNCVFFSSLRKQWIGAFIADREECISDFQTLPKAFIKEGISP